MISGRNHRSRALESLTEDLPRLSAALRRCLDTMAKRLGNDDWASLMGRDLELLNPAMIDDISVRFTDALGGTRRIKEVARGLGTFARVDEGRLEPVNLMHVIEVALSMVSNELKHRAHLVKDYGQISSVAANDGRLSQVFLNLLINATHAIPDGNRDGHQIRVRTWQEGETVFAEVRDSGKGISPKHLAQLFEPFFTTKETGKGTGLGLAISKSIVEEYGGRIEVTSELGKGTSFVVSLPIRPHAEASESALTKATAAEPAAEPAAGGRILVVDDEEAIRRTMLRILRGHDVVQAASGAEARKILGEDQAFDLVLCDMMMPEMSGMELHQWLTTAHPALAKQFVFITGGAFTPKAREYLSKVDNLQLEKPFDLTHFKKIVGALVRDAKHSGDAS